MAKERVNPEAAQRFVQELLALVASLRGFVSEDGLKAAEHLINHNEAGEALLSLAEHIVAEDVVVPRTALAELHRLGDDFVREDWPSGLDSHAGD